MKNSHILIIEIALPSIDVAQIIYKALKPEVGTKVQLFLVGETLKLRLVAESIAMLRALTNSYLRLIGLIIKILNIMI